MLVGRVRIRAGTFETYRHREHPRRARVAECIRIVRVGDMRVGDMRGRGVRVCFRHFFDVRGRDMRVRNGQAQAACVAGECIHGRALATNISSARVFVTPVRVDRPRQKRPLRRHASASGITFVAHVEVRAVAIRQSRRAPRFAAAHALASCDPRRARPWPHAGNMLVRGMRVATCACARCVFPQAMHVSAARAAITTPAALRAKRHASRTSNAPVGCPDSIRLYSALFGSIRLESNRLESSLPRTLPDRAVHRFRTPPCTQAPPRRASPRPPQSTRIETAAIRGRTRRRDAPEMPAQRLLRAEPRERGNARDGQRGIALDHLLREPDPLADQPFVRAEPGRVAKLPLQRARTHRRARGERRERMRLPRVCAHPVDQLREPVAADARQRPRHELRLAAVAMRRQHEPLRDAIRDRAAVIAAHEMHQHVEARRRTRRRDDPPRVDIERIGIHAQRRIARPQALGVAPVRGDGRAVEHARRGQHEHARADRA
ncbi:hypothetical protein BURPS1710b_A2215 [Burkholderia pseudomallei 1710b]|uniref:Uncharacterized protein n=1 Tax=Burkholderia pseudomallei (strain 1710b) TaxID=320372 RepID=Q3JGD7_BURP1|nr:hypothetical protein BURPS1710b_A2215 [Burkholderia pseudomallei 1710b]